MAKYRKYSKEFKLQAAKLVTEQGYSYDKAAKRLGTTGFSVRNWVKTFQQTGELPSKAESQPKVDEIRQLRKELAQLKMENEILKKAALFNCGYVQSATSLYQRLLRQHKTPAICSTGQAKNY